ncbi:MarR family winged helix-turn-helix transcriptional regulator [Micromonospora vulcania]|uniref:MarR family winged helix-turn-helix transcriptional regulator n=1 Tax=Micromonospora vulcania TaxID=1441873 RepID=A0ABW1HEG5_9ACTN
MRSTRTETKTLLTPRAEVLGQLVRNGPQTIAELAARRGVRHQTMSRMVGDLEQLGLADRAPNPADARGFVISLTEAGQAAVDADRAARRDWLAQAIALRLDEDDREALAHIPQLLTKLVE